MSDQESNLKNTEHREKNEINKKILVSKFDYQNKFCSCVEWCFPLATGTFLASLGGIPLILKLIPRISLTLEIRAMAGLMSGLPLGYAVAKWRRESCEKRVQETYYYRIKE